MRTVWAWTVLIACWPIAVLAAEPGIAMLRIESADVRSQARELLAVTQARWLPRGLVADPKAAWLSLSEPLPVGATIEVLPLWSVDDTAPPLPLMFELRMDSQTTIRATLGTRMLRKVMIATRRLRRGSTVSCADVTVALREIHSVTTSITNEPCAFAADDVALRDIAIGDVVRSSDAGTALDVFAGMSVRVSASSRAVSVSTSAIALADAKVGDRIDIRLQHPTRTLKARVVAPGAVQLSDERS